MSRLSKRTTRKPRSASIAQKLLVPGEHLGRQAHDQQQRLAARGRRSPGRRARSVDGASRSSAGRSASRLRGSLAIRGSWLGSQAVGWQRAHRDRLRPPPRQRLRRGPAARRRDPRACCSRRSRAADRLVLLGDALELRDLPLAEALEPPRPFFEELGEAMAGRRGRCSSPATTTTASPSRCSSGARSRREPALGLEHRRPPGDGRRPRIDALARRRRARARLPRASGCATTSTPPTATTWTAT